MSTKEALKAKICIQKLEPNFPLREVVEWAEALDKQQVLLLLDEIQTELDTQAQQNRQNTATEKDKVLLSYWCFYCAQMRSYYRSIIRDPHNSRRWSFLW